MREKTLTLTPNRRGVQPYLSYDLIGDSRCQLEQGQEVTATITPSGNILLHPLDDTPDWRTDDV